MSSAIEARLEGLAAHLSPVGLDAIIWSTFGVAFCFVTARCLVRQFNLKRLQVDDYWMIAALVALLTNAVLQTLQTPHLYYLLDVEVGGVPAGEAVFLHGDVYVRYEFAVILLFWTVLWCVKASFLSLYYPLFDGFPMHRRCWWMVVLFTVLAYIGCWIVSLITCHPTSAYFQFGQCEKPIDIRGGNISICYSTAVDIVSDVMIMILPLGLINKLQASRRQKIGLAGVFCVGILVITSTIVRLTQIIGQARQDPVGLTVWGVVESSTSVVVGCLPPLKGVLGRTLKRTRRGNVPLEDNVTIGRNGRFKVKAVELSNSEETWRTASLPFDGSGDTITNNETHSESKEGTVIRQHELGWCRTNSDEDVESARPDSDEDMDGDEARIAGRAS